MSEERFVLFIAGLGEFNNRVAEEEAEQEQEELEARRKEEEQQEEENTVVTSLNRKSSVRIPKKPDPSLVIDPALHALLTNPR